MKKRLFTALVVLAGIFLLSASIVWSAPAPVPKTGQTTTYKVGDDGTYEKGVASPSPRFTDIGDGTVIDRLTGLMWAKDAHSEDRMGWDDAIDYANNLSLGTSCGTPRTDWRLPNVREMQSLVDYSYNSGTYLDSLPAGHPFVNLGYADCDCARFWTSTTGIVNSPLDTTKVVSLRDGNVQESTRGVGYRVWPVRGGN